MSEETQNKESWYVIRVTYSRELLVKSQLDSMGIENYVPMRLIERKYGNKTRKVWKPLIHNLLFVRMPAAEMQRFKADTTLPIRYVMDRGSKSPSVVPDREMQDFMAIVATRNEHVEIVGPRDIDLTSGDRVRVTDGIFAGIEGRYIRHKGHSKVAVAIRNVATALTAYVPLRYITKIE